MGMGKRSWMKLRHRATGETAIGVRRPDGMVLVQFDRYPHPHAHGWHMYPRHHFHRLRGRAMTYDGPEYGTVVTLPEVKSVKPYVAEHIGREFKRRMSEAVDRARMHYAQGEPLPPYVVGNQAGYFPS